MIGNETFRGNPVSLDISRSKFHQCPVNSGSFKAGELVPFYMNSLIMPGTTIKCDLRTCIRMSTPVGVPMDNLYMDVGFFFVPHNLTLSRQSMSPSVNDSNRSFDAFMGAQDSLLNMPTPSEIKLPHFTLNEGQTPVVGGLWDWTGCSMKTLSGDVEVNPLNFLAYAKIWNDYYRDPNGSMNPVTYSISSYSSVSLSGGPSGWASSLQSLKLLPVCRFHGYFGSALPWPQRNSAMVTIPIGDSANVVAASSTHSTGNQIKLGAVNGLSGYYPLYEKQGGGLYVASSNAVSSLTSPVASNITNLVADLSSVAGITVNQFRQLVQEQRWYEALARGGNNTLAELTATTFGVTPSFATANRAEFLGSRRIPLNIIQVNNTAGSAVSTDKQSSLGSTGSFSLTNSQDYLFSKSFDTWGSLIGVACVRCDDTFHQGLDRQYSKFNRFDYYWPQFANLGEQAVSENELYLTGESSDSSVFGYQEAWAEYRFSPNHVCGLLRPDQSLGYWTFANNFSAAPTLNSFISAAGQVSNVDQCLQVSNATAGFQFIGQFATDLTIVYPMPTYSIPGLVDHH